MATAIINGHSLELTEVTKPLTHVRAQLVALGLDGTMWEGEILCKNARRLILFYRKPSGEYVMHP